MMVNEEYLTPVEYLTAAECGPRVELTPAALLQRIILAATHHANRLGCGFADLIRLGNAWVLSRVSFEVERWPGVGAPVQLATWIESFNRYLSHRNFAFLDDRGQPWGHARTLWACINVDTRRPAAIEPLTLFGTRPCPIADMPRLRPVDNPERVVDYAFTYADIDFNGHVNSARYLELLENCFPLDYHLGHALHRLDLNYNHEALYRQDARVLIANPAPMQYVLDVNDADNGNFCRAQLTYRPDESRKIR